MLPLMNCRQIRRLNSASLPVVHVSTISDSLTLHWFGVWNECNLENHDTRHSVSTLLPSAFVGGDL